MGQVRKHSRQELRILISILSTTIGWVPTYLTVDWGTDGDVEQWDKHKGGQDPALHCEEVPGHGVGHPVT